MGGRQASCNRRLLLLGERIRGSAVPSRPLAVVVTSAAVALPRKHPHSFPSPLAEAVRHDFEGEDRDGLGVDRP